MKVDDKPENADRCICPVCPTFNDCMRERGQKLFCSRDSSDCGPRAMSCICGDCPVWDQYELVSYYFCIDGSAT